MSTKIVLNVLRFGRALISSPDKWTVDAYARDKEGWPCDEQGDEAVCWCTLGAMYKAWTNFCCSKEEFDEAKGLLRVEFGKPIPQGNDSSTHAEVLAYWDGAIRKAEDL